jgi:GNAT superfamily N-acetyltransferase
MNQDNGPASPETIQARCGQPWEQIARPADQHTQSVQSWLPTRTPQAKRFQGVGVCAGSSGLPVPLLNLALGARYPAGTAQQTIAAEIQRVKAFFAQRSVPWYWWLGPFPQPSNIAQQLEQNGLIFDRPALPAMAAPLPAPLPQLNPNVEVWQAESRADLQAASTIRRVAFRFPDGVATNYFEAMADDWLRGDPARLYLARLPDGPPSAIGALIMGAGIPGVYVMATLPNWRRRGLGKAILTRILSEAAAGGHQLIALTAGKMGYPLYRQFGFEHIFSYNIYRPT